MKKIEIYGGGKRYDIYKDLIKLVGQEEGLPDDKLTKFIMF